MRARNERHLASLLTPVHEPQGATLVARAAAFGIQPPPEFTFREYAVFLLTIGAQIEHSLMVQYLYAAWSLGGPRSPTSTVKRCRRGGKCILGIAKRRWGTL